MTRTVRSMLTALALGFAVYFVARAVWWVEQPSAPLLMVAGIAVYLTAILVAVLAGSAARVQMPMWAAISALIAGVAVPSLVSLALDPMMRSAGFATWYIGAVGVLAVVCIVRRRAVFGWVIVSVLVISASAYLGVGDAFTLGLVGSITWVVLAQLLVFFWGRAVRDTERFADIQRARRLVADDSAGPSTRAAIARSGGSCRRRSSAHTNGVHRRAPQRERAAQRPSGGGADAR